MPEQLASVFTSYFGVIPGSEWLIAGWNLILLIFAKPIYRRLSHDHLDQSNTQRQLHFFRLINILIIVLILSRNWVWPILPKSLLGKTVVALFVIYMCALGFKVCLFLIRSRYGKSREVGGEFVISETYSSRALSIITALLLISICLIAIIDIFDFESLLQAGGVLGFLGVMLALTQGAWAPDIISGLIMLNSTLFEEGDVVELEIESKPIYGVVFRTKMFHTELLDLVNNHRIMLKNTLLRNSVINNLSKFASAKGLREQLSFNIAYEMGTAQVHAFFERVNKHLIKKHAGLFEAQYPLEVRALNPGDFAVEWACFYYTKNVRNLLSTRQAITETILDLASQEKLSLATPSQHLVTRTNSPPQTASS